MNIPAAAEPAPLRRSVALERRLRRRRQEARMRLKLAADAVVLSEHHAAGAALRPPCARGRGPAAAARPRLDHDAQLEAERTTFAGSTAEGRDLADEVRRLQKERPGARAQWATYCHEQTNGVKDPLRHSVASLRNFLLEIDL